MTGQTTALVAVSAAASVAIAGPLAEVFNELGLTLAIMGGLGGLTRGLAIWPPMREVARGVALGVLFGFGFGVTGPEIVHRVTGLEVAVGAHSIPALAAAAFSIGFLQDFLVSWFRARAKAKRGGQE